MLHDRRIDSLPWSAVLRADRNVTRRRWTGTKNWRRPEDPGLGTGFLAPGGEGMTPVMGRDPRAAGWMSARTSNRLLAADLQARFKEPGLWKASTFLGEMWISPRVGFLGPCCVPARLPSSLNGQEVVRGDRPIGNFTFPGGKTSSPVGRVPEPPCLGLEHARTIRTFSVIEIARGHVSRSCERSTEAWIDRSRGES